MIFFLTTSICTSVLEERGKRKKCFQIKWEFKDSNRKPWLQTIENESGKEHKAFCKLLDKHKEKIGIKDFSDGSTYIEHHLKFWGDMVLHSGGTEEQIRTLENWPNGVIKCNWSCEALFPPSFPSFFFSHTENTLTNL